MSKKISKKSNKADLKDPRSGKSWLYSEVVKKHFFEPQNIMREEDEKAFEKKGNFGVGIVGSPACGDEMKVWIRVKCQSDDRSQCIIKECKWRTYGCASAIAATSMMSTMVIGMTLEQAKKVTPKMIIDNLMGLPNIKVHCSVLGDQALKAAIEDFESKLANVSNVAKVSKDK